MAKYARIMRGINGILTGIELPWSLHKVPIQATVELRYTNCNCYHLYLVPGQCVFMDTRQMLFEYTVVATMCIIMCHCTLLVKEQMAPLI